MNKSAKILTGALSLVMAASLSACAPKGTTNAGNQAQPTATPKPAQPVQLNFVRWSNGPDLDKEETDKVNRFNSSHPDVHVNMTMLPYDQTFKKIELSLASNNPVDIFYWDDQAYAWYKKGLVKNLQPYFDKDLKAADYNQKLFDPYKFDGKNMYVAPENYQTIMLYYNKDLFDKAHLSYPDANWTWDDVIKAAQKLTVTQNGKTVQYGLDMGDMGNWWGWTDLIFEQGGNIVDNMHEPTKVTLDTPEAKNAMQLMTDVQYKYHVAPTATEKTALGGDFFSGKIGIYIGGDWNLATAKAVKDFKWDIAPLPSWNGKRATPYFVGGYSITSKSQNPDAAWEFIKWTMTDNQKTLADQGSWIPVYQPVLSNLTPPAWAPSGYKAARLDWMQGGILGSVFSEKWSQVLDKAINPTTDQLFNNKVTVDQGMKDMNDKANQALSGQ